MSGLNGVSPPIGGFTLEAGGCFTQAVTIAGVTLTGMTVTCSPRTPPPNGVTWEGYASNPNEVTLKICTSIAGFIPASIYDINVVAGGSGPTGFPAVVAAVNFTGQTATLSFDLLAAPTTGDYVLNDYLTIVTPDPSAKLIYRVIWEDDQGFASANSNDNGIAIPNNTGSLSAQAGFSNNWDSSACFCPPTVLHALAGTPISVLINMQPTGIATAQPYAGSAGLLYAPGDTGTVNDGNLLAQYEVLTTDPVTGAVLTLSITFGGNGYGVSVYDTTVLTGAGDGTLQIDVLTLLPLALVFSYHATLVQNQ